MYHSPMVKWYVCMCYMCVGAWVCVHVPVHLSSCECQELLYMYVMCVCVHIFILFLKKSKSQLLRAHLLDLTDTDPDICSTREHQARERIRYGIMHHMILYNMYRMIPTLCITWSHTLCITWCCYWDHVMHNVGIVFIHRGTL